MDREALALNHTNRMHNMPVGDVKDSLKMFLLWHCKDEHYAYEIIVKLAVGASDCLCQGRGNKKNHEQRMSIVRKPKTRNP